MKLFGSRTSPYVRHCRVALVKQDMAFEFVETDYAASARQSPTRRVPFLEHEGSGGVAVRLTDSTSILRWVRERDGRTFLADPAAFDRYLMVNTAMDATVNLFLLERDGLRPDEVPYLARQRDRVDSSLAELDRQFTDAPHADDDGLRLACFLSWAAFRNRIQTGSYPALERVVEAWDADPTFAGTHPSRAG